jgi:hypothetical protein
MPEMIEAGCHDLDQSLFGDVGANADIIDVVFLATTVKSIELQLVSHQGMPKKPESDVNQIFRRYGL